MAMNEKEWLCAHAYLQWIMKKNKILGKKKIYMFLDFDGVINIFYKEGTPEYEALMKSKYFEFADKKCVRRLSDLCLEFDIDVVISSSWRYSGVEYCTQYLREAGLDERVKVVGTTEEDFHSRQEQIYNYLKKHLDFTGFVVIDDIDMTQLARYQVVTDIWEGLTEEKILEAKKILLDK